MAVKGACMVVELGVTGGNMLDVYIRVVSLDDTVPYVDQVWAYNNDPSTFTNQIVLDTAEAALVNAGVTFGGGDTVILIPN